MSIEKYKYDNNFDQSLITLLTDLVNIRSENPPGLEKELIDYMEKFFKDAKLKTYRLETPLLGRDNLLAVLEGSEQEHKVTSKSNNKGETRSASENEKGGTIFTGHSDVVTVSEIELKKWETDPFISCIRDGYIYGRGSCDMKSGLAAASLALANLSKIGFKPKYNLAILVTVDEEDSMLGSRSLVGNELLKSYTNLVVCEPSSLHMCTKSRGRTYGIVECKGQTSHASKPEEGINSIILANKFINKILDIDLTEYSNEYGSSHIRPLSIHAKVDPWVVPDKCSIGLDARLTLGHYPADVWKKVDEIIKELNAEIKSGSKLDYNIIDEREPWSQDSCDLVSNFKSILSSYELDTNEYCFTGTTDGTPLRRDGRNVIIIGPGDLSYAHKENERVSIDELILAYKIYIEYMLNA